MLRISTSKLVSVLSVCGLFALALVMSVAPAAYADSPDPSDSISGVVTNHSDGTHTLTLSGGWVWNRGCDERIVGWEVDWNDPNQPGNVVGTVNGVTTDVGAATANSLNPADNTVDIEPQNCTQESSGSSGNWGPISHRYAASVKSVDVCVVVYDTKGTERASGRHSLVAGGANHNTDNSVEENFNASQNGCFTTRFTFPGSITIVEDSVSDDAQNFSYAAPAAIGGFDLDDDADPSLPNTRTFTGLETGTYAVSQSIVPGWTLSSIVCSDPSGGTVTSASAASINLADGENVTCTFTNTKQVDVPSLDVAIDKDDAGRTFSVGAPGTYTLRVTNVSGVATTAPVVVTDVLPAGLSFVSASGTGWSCGASAATITCTYAGVLAPSSSAPDITVRVDVAQAALPQVINTAAVATPGDINPTNDRDTETTPVVAEPFVDLAIDKADGGVTFKVGQNGSYTLRVTNVGTAPTTGPVTITDTLPTGLGFVSAAGTGWVCSDAAPGITCTYSGTIDPDEVAPAITIHVSVAEAAVPNVINAARVSTTGDDNPSNDNDTEATPVLRVLGETQRRATPPAVGGTSLPRTGQAEVVAALIALAMLGTGMALRLDRNGVGFPR